MKANEINITQVNEDINGVTKETNKTKKKKVKTINKKQL